MQEQTAPDALGDPAASAASQQGPEAQGRAGQGCEQLEAQYVHQVYDAISPHFSATRFAIWPKYGPALFCSATNAP